MKRLFILAIAAALVGCASAPPRAPIIDRVGSPDGSDYHSDLGECRSLARTESAGGLAGALGGAVVGFALGAVMGKVVGGGVDVGSMARFGAVVGGAQGFGQTVNSESAIMQRCMQGRGYNVVG